MNAGVEILFMFWTLPGGSGLNCEPGEEGCEIRECEAWDDECIAAQAEREGEVRDQVDDEARDIADENNLEPVDVAETIVDAVTL